jgi:hypothetical protein
MVSSSFLSDNRITATNTRHFHALLWKLKRIYKGVNYYEQVLEHWYGSCYSVDGIVGMCWIP